MIADHVAKLQFWTEVVQVAVDAEAQGQRPGEERLIFALVPDPHVVADGPIALVILEVAHEPGLGRIAEQGAESAFSVVVVAAVEIDDGLALHVRLPGKDEHLDRLGRLRGMNNRSNP